MEKIFILRKSGLIDYFLLELYDFNWKDGIVEAIGRELIKILFLVYLIYREFNKPKKNELKGLVKKENYFRLIQLIVLQFSLFLDRKNKDFLNVFETLNSLSFICLFYIIRSDLKA